MHPITIIGWVVFGFIGAYIFAKKGYRPLVGAIIGALFGPIGLLISLILPRTADAVEDAEASKQLQDELIAARKQKRCPQCGCSHSVINPFCPSCMHPY